MKTAIRIIAVCILLLSWFAVFANAYLAAASFGESLTLNAIHFSLRELCALAFAIYFSPMLERTVRSGSLAHTPTS
jgi:hypothetical protein